MPSGPGGTWTMADLGYDDPELLAQLNAGVLGANMPYNTYGQTSPRAQLMGPGGTFLPIVRAGGGTPAVPTVSGGGGSNPQDPWIGLNTITDPTTLTLTTTGGGGLPTTGGGGCDLLPAGTARELCKLGAAGYNAWQNRNQGTNTGGCPEGYEPNPNAGKPGQAACRIKGIGSYLPGDIGNPDLVWTPINGRYGQGVTPVAVQTQRRACPSGYVLGKDGVCYDRLARTHRAWNPGAKPLLTGGDMNALRRAHQLQKQIGKINRRFGKKTPKQCAPKRKR